jgi:hypothetical protein
MDENKLKNDLQSIVDYNKGFKLGKCDIYKNVFRPIKILSSQNAVHIKNKKAFFTGYLNSHGKVYNKN